MTSYNYAYDTAFFTLPVLQTSMPLVLNWWSRKSCNHPTLTTPQSPTLLSMPEQFYKFHTIATFLNSIFGARTMV